jgi:phosphohistidine phosphatase
MRLYLIRHAKAAEAATDHKRPLSAEGVQQATHLANALHGLGVRWGAIATSPLARARQTAEILRAAGLAPRVDETAELAPGAGVAGCLLDLGSWLSGECGDLAAVGHLPSLVEWAEELAFGDARGRLILPPAGLIALELPARGDLRGACQLFWLASPLLLR